ncbi:hypothetical protein HDV03_001663 [Kappamyces sp. JEL0829]|nr:hypothetical protein HDV03_001663 [Kappamyces sp. JEL0829]
MSTVEPEPLSYQIIHSLLGAASTALSMYVIYHQIKTKGKTKKLFLFTQSVNIVTQLVIVPYSLNPFWISLVYAELANLLVFLIVWVNLHLLRLYDVLDERIAARRITMVKVVLTCLFVPFEVFYILHQCWDSPLITWGNNISSTLFITMSFLWDLFQMCYLVLLVYSLKDKYDPQVSQSMARLTLISAVLTLTDVVGILLYTLYVYGVVTLNFIPVAVPILGFHCSGTVLVFEQLKRLTPPMTFRWG